MKTKYVLFIIMFVLVTNVFSQASLNDYKYIIVPEQYSFFKKANKYQLNELTKFLFNKNGFVSFISNEKFPKDLSSDGCLALRADVIKESAIFKTKLIVELKDCRGKIIFVSRVGETREKDLKKAYNLALRDAFTSFEDVNYKYVPKEDEIVVSNDIETPSSTDKEEVKKLQQQVEALKAEKQKQLQQLAAAKITKEKQATEKVKQEAEQLKKTIATTDDKEKVVQELGDKVSKEITKSNTILYAQAIANGYQLVDSTPKVVMILLKTGRTNTFIVKGESATVYKEDGFWYISKTDGDKVSTETLNIKF